MTCEDKLYKNQGNRSLLDLLTNRTPGRALDCGCGAGDNARILVSRGWTVTGITVSKQESVAASEFCERVILHDLESGLPSLPLTYDLVVLSHILEHLAYPAILLKQLLASCRSCASEHGMSPGRETNPRCWKFLTAAIGPLPF
jgi:2-polyprenyl-3-methyl-5-hydroxy-6-metoxy-1,4-benzoquinol methylase